MSSERTQFQKDVFRRVDEILHFIWDPIGVCEIPQARDEYQSYVPKVAGFLLEQKKKEELEAYLHWLESEHIGCPVTDETRAHTKEVVEILHDHFEWMKQEADPDRQRTTRGK
jgi:hypothetical protein